MIPGNALGKNSAYGNIALDRLLIPLEEKKKTQTTKNNLFSSLFRSIPVTSIMDYSIVRLNPVDKMTPLTTVLTWILHYAVIFF